MRNSLENYKMCENIKAEIFKISQTSRFFLELVPIYRKLAGN